MGMLDKKYHDSNIIIVGLRKRPELGQKKFALVRAVWPCLLCH
jgi:hypothetical protein